MCLTNNRHHFFLCIDHRWRQSKENPFYPLLTMDIHVAWLLSGSTQNISHVRQSKQHSFSLRPIRSCRLFICTACPALVRHCACTCSHFSWAHIAWSIHMQYTHKTTSRLPECSSVCPVRASGWQEMYRYLPCLPPSVFSALIQTIPSFSYAHTQLPPPLAQTHTDNAGSCVNQANIYLHS